MNIGFAYAVGAAITWGVVYTIDQKILVATSPLTLLFINSFITALIILPVLFIDRISIAALLASGKRNLVLVLVSITLAAVANYFIFAAIKHVGAAPASIIEIAYPFFVTLFTFIAFQTLPSIYTLAGGLLIFIGAAMITYFH